VLPTSRLSWINAADVMVDHGRLHCSTLPCRPRRRWRALSGRATSATSRALTGDRRNADCREMYEVKTNYKVNVSPMNCVRAFKPAIVVTRYVQISSSFNGSRSKAKARDCFYESEVKKLLTYLSMIRAGCPLIVGFYSLLCDGQSWLRVF